MTYCGQLSTSLINDRQIRPTEYRRWRDAERRFSRGRDRCTVDACKAEIRSNGGRLKVPIRLNVDDRTHEVAVGDGHHRVIALQELGIAAFDFTWGWRRAWSNTTSHEPFPYHLVGQ